MKLLDGCHLWKSLPWKVHFSFQYGVFIHFHVFGSFPSPNFEFELWSALHLGIFELFSKVRCFFCVLCFVLCACLPIFSTWRNYKFFPKNLFLLHYMQKHRHLSDSISIFSCHNTSHLSLNEMRLHVFHLIHHPHMHVIPFSTSIFTHLTFRFHSHDTITQNVLHVIASKRSDFD